MKRTFLLLVLVSVVISFTSCMSAKGNAKGGCQVNRNLVGYK
ncbi:MAG: hypothetical protein RLY11_376 [Bacteroidota bacterium]|jgi:hypothetical protein